MERTARPSRLLWRQTPLCSAAVANANRLKRNAVVLLLCVSATACTPVAEGPAVSQPVPLSAHPPDAREQDAILHDVRKMLPEGMQPQLGKTLFARVLGGGSYTCGMMRSVDYRGRPSPWRVFELTVPMTGKTSAEISGPGAEQVLLERCAARGLALED